MAMIINRVSNFQGALPVPQKESGRHRNDPETTRQTKHGRMQPPHNYYYYYYVLHTLYCCWAVHKLPSRVPVAVVYLLLLLLLLLLFQLAFNCQHDRMQTRAVLTWRQLAALVPKRRRCCTRKRLENDDLQLHRELFNLYFNFYSLFFTL